MNETLSLDENKTPEGKNKDELSKFGKILRPKALYRNIFLNHQILY